VPAQQGQELVIRLLDSRLGGDQFALSSRCDQISVLRFELGNALPCPLDNYLGLLPPRRMPKAARIADKLLDQIQRVANIELQFLQRLIGNSIAPSLRLPAIVAQLGRNTTVWQWAFCYHPRLEIGRMR